MKREQSFTYFTQKKNRVAYERPFFQGETKIEFVEHDIPA